MTQQRIPQAFINDLVSRVDIVELIESRLPLKKAGSNYQACCPFHSEKTPSFSVSPSKQFYHCFGCNASGNVIGFIMEYDRLSFLDAIETLASYAGVAIPREMTQSQYNQHLPLYDISKQASLLYQQQLRQPAAQHAIDYLKSRGLSGEICQHFQLGFAPDGWDFLLKQHQTQKGLLAQAGLAITNDKGRQYDRFRNRLMFPILDRRGRHIGFGGRVLDDSTPKYLNSPETDIFHKGQELYGFYQALQSNKRLPQIIIVEGYMDVLALHQFGLTFAVATLGTATSKLHLQTLFRHCQEIIFCFDGDNAGNAAAWRAMETLLPLMDDGRQARFMFLPQGEDPDTLIRSLGKEGFQQKIQQALPLSGYILTKITQDVDMNSLDSRATLAKFVRPILEKLPDNVYRHMLLESMAKLLDMGSDRLQQLLLPNATTAPPTTAEKQPTAKVNKSKTPSPIRLAIALTIQYPQLVKQLQDASELKLLEIPGSDLLCRLVEQIKQAPDITTGTILETWRHQPEINHITKLATWQHHYPENGVEAEYLGAITILKNMAKQHEIEKLMSKASQQSLSSQEKQTLKELLSQK